MKQEFIYILVGFPHSYMRARGRRWEIEKPMNELHRKRRKGESYDEILLKNLENQWGAFRESDQYHEILMGGVNKGFFLSKEDAIAFLEENGDSIHEGAYYTHFLIEMRRIGYEGYGFGDDVETWFVGESTGEGWHDYRYVPCERPECFTGVMGFA